MKIACIILSYKGAASALRLVDSLRAMTRTQDYLFVVENGSPGNDLEVLSAALGRDSVIHTAENLGYAGGMNLGLKHALASTDAECFWILTKDLTVEPDTLAILESLWPRLAQPGMLGALTDLNGTDQVYFFRSVIDSAGRTRHGNKGRTIPEIPELREEFGHTDYVNGACVFTSRDVLNTVGLIPEDYFLYFEDCDWGLRATRAGFKNYVSYRARVHHHREVGGFSRTAEYYCRRNAFVFRKKNGFAKPWSKLFELLHIQKALLKFGLKGQKQMVEVLRAVAKDIRQDKSGLGPWR